ncbi:hypothetical protein GCM10009715_01260 [Paeniglutamicibacter psychrophenolicus]
MTLRSRRTSGHNAQERIKAIRIGSAITLKRRRLKTTAEANTSTTNNWTDRVATRPRGSIHIPDTLWAGGATTAAAAGASSGGIVRGFLLKPSFADIQ